MDSLTDNKTEAFKVYKEIISAIANGETADWNHICEAVDYDGLDYIMSLGFVKVNPEVINNEVCYRIDKEETDKNPKLYNGLFEPEWGYWCHQVTYFEDCYSGQLLLPFGYTGKMLCVEYSC